MNDDGAISNGSEGEDARRPNVVVVLLDDVGFGAAGALGGPIATPTLPRVVLPRYRVAARCANTPESAAANIGFRCADD